mgnify:CR=1 FL=1
MRVGRSYHSRQKRTKKASSPVKLNNQLKNGDVREKAHRKHYRVRPKSGWLLSFGCFGRHRGRSVRFLMACNGEKWICASVCVTMVQTNPTDKKMTSSTKIPNFSAFCKKKERLRHGPFILCGYVDYNQILKNAGRFEKAQRKSKKHLHIFFIRMWIYFIIIQIIKLHWHSRVYRENFRTHAIKINAHDQSVFCAW